MKAPRILTLVFTAIIIVSCGCGRKVPGTDRAIVSVTAEDAAMNRAIAEARASVGEFIRKFQNPSPDETDFAVKMPISDEKQTEHFWLGNLTYSNGVFFGTINNDAETVKTVTLGQKCSVKEGDISDWLYMKGRKMIGNRTLTALFPHMPPEDVAAIKKQFEMD